MRPIDIMRRVLFYGVIILISVITFYFFNLSIKGEHAYKAFLSLAILSGSIQSINFLVIRKISDIQKLQNIGFWARWRLRPRVELRRKTAFSRAIIGILTALVTGGFSAWMNIIGAKMVPYWGLGIAAGMSIISIIMLFLTVYEYSVMLKLETDMSWMSEKVDQKQNALNSINGDDKKT
jgi:hypothetical protein